MANILTNGFEAGWANVIVGIVGVPTTAITELSYSDSQIVTNQYGTGVQPVSRTFGPVEYSGSLTLHLSAFDALVSAAPFGRIQNIPPFVITVVYAPQGQTAGFIPKTHAITQVTFMSAEVSHSQGDEIILVTVPFLPGGIDYVAG